MTFEDMLADVDEFHSEMGFPPHHDPEFKISDSQIRCKRQRLIKEEARELHGALDGGDIGEVLHEAIDAMYVIMGALHEANLTGAQISEAWDLVHEANLQKLAPDDPMYKPSKPPGWEKADMTQALLASDDEPEIIEITYDDVSDFMDEIGSEALGFGYVECLAALQDAEGDRECALRWLTGVSDWTAS